MITSDLDLVMYITRLRFPSKLPAKLVLQLIKKKAWKISTKIIYFKMKMSKNIKNDIIL